MLNALNAAKKIPAWAYLTVAAGVALYIVKKGGVQGAAAGVVAAVVSTSGDIAIGTTKGAVLGVGDVFGVPRTDITLCKQAIGMADNGKALNYCSAGVFARWQYLSTRKRLTGKTFTMYDVFN